MNRYKSYVTGVQNEGGSKATFGQCPKEKRFVFWIASLHCWHIQSTLSSNGQHFESNSLLLSTAQHLVDLCKDFQRCSKFDQLYTWKIFRISNGFDHLNLKSVPDKYILKISHFFYWWCVHRLCIFATPNVLSAGGFPSRPKLSFGAIVHVMCLKTRRGRPHW